VEPGGRGEEIVCRRSGWDSSPNFSHRAEAEQGGKGLQRKASPLPYVQRRRKEKADHEPHSDADNCRRSFSARIERRVTVLVRNVKIIIRKEIFVRGRAAACPKNNPSGYMDRRRSEHERKIAAAS